MRRLLVAWLGVVAMCCCGLPVAAQTLEVDGSMRSDVAFELTQGIALPGGAQRVSVSFVVPEEFVSPTFVQKIRDYSLRFSPRPDARENTTDIRGNRIITATWSNPPRNLDMTVSFQVDNQTLLQRLETTAVFPVRKVPPSVAPYLESSEQVQADDARIRALAERLTGGASTEYEAVQRIVGHVVDNLRYVNPPEKFDALYSLETGKGNCQNYSHLCAALLRASGIPARIVNGYTLGKTVQRAGRALHLYIQVGGRPAFVDRGLVSRSGGGFPLTRKRHPFSWPTGSSGWKPEWTTRKPSMTAVSAMSACPPHRRVHGSKAVWEVISPQMRWL